jgi:antitoxin component of RelBE/YafQ-DinJ toxin-antitoxin module
MKKRMYIMIDEKLLESAKKYANNHNISISHLVETYLNYMCNKKRTEVDISPLVRSLSGIITLTEDYDSKEDYTRQVIEKYK